MRPEPVDITVDGNEIKAVAQVSKQGFTYVFDRVTGEPVWPIVERSVTQSRVPGEETSSTQPFPTKPPPFETQGITEDNLIDLTAELKAQALEIIESYETGPIFTPPIATGQDGKRGLIQLPGMIGGANWPGAAVDPETGILYVQSITRPFVMALRKGGRFGDLDYNRGGGGTPQVEGLPLVKPPWGRITAIDLNKGEFAWQIPHGDGPRDHPLLADLDLGQLGSDYVTGLAGPGTLVTKTLLFANQDQAAVRGSRAGDTGFLRAFDKATGELIWEATTASAPVTPPMTYVYGGRQYVLFAVGGSRQEKELIAFALPGE